MKVQSESALEPAVRTLVRDLLCKPSSSRQLYRIVGSHVLADEDIYRNADCKSSSDDEDKSSKRNSDRGSPYEASVEQGKMKVECCSTFFGEETWLVPVSTARAVLAVLKINVRSSTEKTDDGNISPLKSFSRVSFSPNDMPQFVSSDDKEVRDDHFCDEETEGKGRTAAARDALITFSNLLAPLLSSSRQREVKQEATSCEVCQNNV